MFTKGFARDLAERVLTTFAQALIAVLIATNTGLLDTDWISVLSVAGMAALISLLKGIGAYGMDRETGASLLGDPPPKVERGASDVWVVVIVVLLVLILLAVVGVI